MSKEQKLTPHNKFNFPPLSSSLVFLCAPYSQSASIPTHSVWHFCQSTSQNPVLNTNRSFLFFFPPSAFFPLLQTMAGTDRQCTAVTLPLPLAPPHLTSVVSSQSLGRVRAWG